MKFTRTCSLIVCIVALLASIGFGDEEKVHPAVKPADYEWSMWMSPDLPAEDQFESYAETLNSILPALQVIAHNGVVAPSVEVLHGYAQVIIHGLEGTGGPHGDLVQLEPERIDMSWAPAEGATISDWIEHFGSLEAYNEFVESIPNPKAELLAPIQDSLDIVKQTNSHFRSCDDCIGLTTMKGGALWVIDWALPQLSIYAEETFPDNPGQQLYIEALGSQVQALLQLALDSAVACIEETDYDVASAHMLNVNAYLFTALGDSLSPGERPVTGTGLYFLLHNLLGWTWFGY